MNPVDWIYLINAVIFDRLEIKYRLLVVSINLLWIKVKNHVGNKM